MEDLMETQTTLPNGKQGLPSGEAPELKLNVTAFPTMEELERQYLNLVLEKTGGNKVQTAKILGFSVKTIYNKLAGYEANKVATTTP
jgi:DNA-binding NtrC family response regulator